MEKRTTFIIILSVIAIIASITSIVLVLKMNSENYVKMEDLYWMQSETTKSIMPTVVKAHDFSDFLKDLEDYNQCINMVLDKYAICNEQIKSLDCRTNLTSELQGCEKTEYRILYKPYS